jgi:hAT family C-terminal dimerisation region
LNSISQRIQRINLNNSDADDNDDSELGVGAYMSGTYNSASNREVDGFEEYISSTVQEDFEMTEWQSIERKHPDLVQFALDHAAILISISECERSFNNAKFALNPLRSRMKSDLFEAPETLRAWYLEEERQRKQEMDRIEQETIAEALKDGEDE